VESRLHLVNWLSERFGTEGGNRPGLVFDAAAMDARSFFAQLPLEQRSAYLRNVYYAELKAGGREYNDVDGKRYGSYLRSREAIATLLPTQDANGQALSYQGDLTMFSSALYYNADYVNNNTGKPRPKPGVNYITKAEWTALGNPGYNVSFYDVLDADTHQLRRRHQHHDSGAYAGRCGRRFQARSWIGRDDAGRGGHPHLCAG
jgi:hypothetical protein